jgi:hypothetical protein
LSKDAISAYSLKDETIIIVIFQIFYKFLSVHGCDVVADLWVGAGGRGQRDDGTDD